MTRQDLIKKSFADMYTTGKSVLLITKRNHEYNT